MGEMFCDQCEQAAGGTGCTGVGVCGKGPEAAALQDLVVAKLKGVAFWADRARSRGGSDRAVDVFLVEALFSTVTNVDFDPESLARVARDCAAMRDRAQGLCERSGAGVPEEVPEPARPWAPAPAVAGLVAEGRRYPVVEPSLDADVRSVQQLLLGGCKGLAAYADHAHTLGEDDDAIYAFLHRALAATLDRDLGLMDFMALALECGKVNLACTGLLNQAHTGRYRHPEPTPVATGTRAGKGILVSGHDLKMLEALLEQTAGRGISVYTHVEMLPAHGYPGLKRHPHLAGNFGGAWQDQCREFQRFPGAIVFNTNCIQRPEESYRGRLFTWGRVQWPGVRHIDGWDFTPVVEAALAAGDLPDAPGGELLTGCGHHAVLKLADRLLAALESGAIRRLFVIGGCDGARPGRDYYTRFVEELPPDTVVLTLACGKYRFNRLDLGDIDGIPRLLDVGQCNDAYSAVRIALALAEARDCTVNELPLSFVLSWYEQKAVAVLLSLLSLGIRDIKLGPTLPAFLTPEVLGFLVEQFDLSPIGTVEEDMAQLLG